MGVTYNNRIVTDGLVLCLDAASKRSYPGTGTTWADLKGGNNGTLVNGPTFDTGNGGSIVFDGTNDYVIANAPKPATSMSVSVWVYPTNVTASWQKVLIFPYGDSSWTAPYYSYQMVFYQNRIGVGFNVNGTYQTGHLQNSHETASNNTWYHIAGTFDSGIIKLYVNSVLKETKDISGNGTSIVYQSARTDVVLGTDAEYFISESFTGDISGVSIYNKTLTADEIRQNYEATKGRYI